MSPGFNTIGRMASLISPGGFLLFLLWALYQEAFVQNAAFAYGVYFCFGVLAAAALLSWYHDYARVLCMAVVVGLAVWGSGSPGPATDITNVATAVLLPLNFGLFAALKERGMSSADGVLKGAFIGAQVLAVRVLAESGNSRLDALLRSGENTNTWTWMPSSAHLSFVIAAGFVLALFVFRRTNVEAGLLWALAAVFAGLNQVATPGALYFYCGGAGLILMFAVLEHGYDIAYRDELTELPGRRAFNEVLQTLRRRYTIALCDVDHFKKFNDAYGHDVGDQVLKMVATTLLQVQGGGRAFRYGGEEFALIFKRRSATDVQPLVESLREAIARMSLPLDEPAHPRHKMIREKPPKVPSNSVNITISIGVADHCPSRSTPRIVLEAADAALYRAKEAGRNCVQLATNG
jgi:diguanylate cyclase (GGDEF)-like protein